MRKSQLMKDVLPLLQIHVLEKNSLDPKKLFLMQPKEIWLEIGFGGGEHLAAQAKQNPEIGFIGAEPFINGIASLLTHIDQNKLNNIRIYPDDARALLDALPDNSLDRCFILFADPWPKARHAERRFVGPQNLPRLARVLKKDSELRLATDDQKLAAWMLEHLEADKNFTAAHKSATIPPEDWVQTRYELKALKAGRKPVYLCYKCQAK